MAVQNTDLLLVQRGAQPYRSSTADLAEFVNSEITVGPGGDVDIATASTTGVIRVGNNLTIDPSTGILNATIPAGLEFKGTWNNKDAAPATGSLSAGNFYIWNGVSPSTLDSTSWGALDTTVVTTSDRLLWNGTDWSNVGALGGSSVTAVTGAAPITVDTTDPDQPEVGITAASGSAAGSMSSADFSKLAGIASGAQVNVNPSQAYGAASDGGTLTLTPGGDSTVLPVATTTNAGLMSATDKTTLDGLSSNPSGVSSVTGGQAITMTGTAAVPTVNVDFGDSPNGTPATVMPYDISLLGDLP